MARKRKGQPIDGWIAIDKPVGIGSTPVVSIVRRVFDAAKAGHGGTLDPLASGILPIALGEATKTVSFVMDGAKTYRTVLAFGQATTTDDCEGTICQTSDHIPDAAAIAAILPRFVGEISQVPPAFSAIKVDGERAYDLARAGEVVELAARIVEIKVIRLLWAEGARAEIEVECGKGTYIRSLVRDIALGLGTFAHVAALRRTKCGPFREENAILLDNFKALGQGPGLLDHLLPIKTALDDIPALALSEAEAGRLSAGQVLPIAGLAHSASALPHNVPLCALSGGRVVALACIDGGFLRSLRVINPTS